jgi:hypothetical protein
VGEVDLVEHKHQRSETNCIKRHLSKEDGIKTSCSDCRYPYCCMKSSPGYQNYQ